jgi:hypothetical protein
MKAFIMKLLTATYHLAVKNQKKRTESEIATLQFSTVLYQFGYPMLRGL